MKVPFVLKWLAFCAGLSALLPVGLAVGLYVSRAPWPWYLLPATLWILGIALLNHVGRKVPSKGPSDPEWLPPG